MEKAIRESGLAPGYWVDVDGNVYKKLKPHSGQRGHRTVNSSPEGKRSRRRSVGQLVLEAWVGPAPDPFHVAFYLDDDPANTRLDNLLWVRRPGRPRKGETWRGAWHRKRLTSSASRVNV